jgi:Prolipoprotein diacylglyceryltransferase
MLASLLEKTQHWPLHAVLEVAAYFAAFRYFLFLKKRHPDPFSQEQRLWILVGAAAGALLGSRLLVLLEHPALFSVSSGGALAVLSNKTIVGGLLGGLVGVELTKKILGLRRSSGDLMTYPLILGMMIGRLGCFFAGLQDATYGAPTSLSWGVDHGDGVARHPTNLYEILFLGMLWVFLRQLERRRGLADGARFKIFMIAYLGFRFWVEFLKPSPDFFFGLSAIQLACAAGLLYYARELAKPSRLLAPLAGS